MNKFTVAVFALSLALPFGAQAQVEGRMNQEQLIQYAIDRNLCEDRSVVSADYVSETDSRVAVTCRGTEGAALQSSSGLGGGAGIAAAALVGLGVVALAAGGSSSSSDTQ